MNRPPLWKISVPVPAEAEEAVSELFENVFGTPPVVWQDARTGRTVVSAYVDAPGNWSAEARAQIEAGLTHVRQCGLALGRTRIQATRLRREDWAESWKRHFRAMEFGRALLVKPSWIRRRPRAGQQVVVLDPGLSFGTGQHPTTGFCLEQIAAGRKPGAGQSLLDIGTGSGILAIAAVKLGYRPVEAYDFDSDAVRVARANARQNGVTRRLSIAQRDLTREPLRTAQKFDMVCANLILDLLLSERGRIVNRLHSGGALVLAGILRKQFPAVASAYGRLGLRLNVSRRQNEWQSGVFVLP
jgi:ribosomal protein L11 methyltransferase